jgi:hypothetical protein
VQLCLYRHELLNLNQKDAKHDDGICGNADGARLGARTSRGAGARGRKKARRAAGF